MSNLEFNFPSAEDIRNIETRAHELRAATFRHAVNATIAFFGRSIKRLGTIGLRHA